MTLGGLAIAIGELVDDAVVDVENIFRRLRENREKGNPRSVFDVVVSASQEVRSGIVYATMIIVLVFVPLFALSGIEGRLFAPLGQAYIISILASLVVSITLTPVMAYYMLPGLKRLDEHEGVVVRVLKRANRRLLDWSFGHPKILITTVLAGVVAAGLFATQLPRSFLPPFNEGTLTINMLFNPGISLAESHRVGLIAERLIMEVPEVEQVGRRTGRAELDEHAEGVHSSEIEVALTADGRSKDEIIADIRSRLSVLPVATNVGQPISHRLDHMLSGVRAQIALKIFGEDLDSIRGFAEEFRGKLAEIPGSSTFRWKSRSASRIWRSSSITAGLPSTAFSRRPSPSSSNDCQTGRSCPASSTATSGSMSCCGWRMISAAPRGSRISSSRHLRAGSPSAR